ncbi:MAG: IS200/IS605 family element transposase accessory protein TnpB [Lachnospiraceae bacterium]|nr:IS200/IS605 family element transposase accessory protein TnpB [Lachnospiraceae bacterium]
MERRYNFRIYPNPAQETQIQKNFGCVRFVYNYYLAKRREAYESGRGIIGYNEMCRDMTKLKRTAGYEWLKEADHNSLQRALKQLDLAFQSFFRNVKKKGTAPGFPAFKSKKSPRQSYTSPASTPRPYMDRRTGELRERKSSVELRENAVKLPKLGMVKCRVSKQAEGRILSATVSRTAAGRYFVSLLFTDWESVAFPQAGRAVGIQLGIKKLVTLSNGTEIENPCYRKRSKEKLIRLQRGLSRKTSGSRNYEKARQRLARAYEHIRNQKTDMLHKLTTQLVREYDMLCIRDEPIKRMSKDRRFAEPLFDAGWGELVSGLSYKCGWYGKTLVKIDPLYPSTRRCSVCGYEYRRLSRQKVIMEWICPGCHARHKRAVNAAVNLLKEGTRLIGAGREAS